MSGFVRLPDLIASHVVVRFIPFLILGGCLVLGLVVLYISGVTRRRRLTNSRQGEDVDSFVSYLSSFGFDAGIARSTYEYLMHEESVAFPVHHSDRLNRDLRISEAEVDLMVENLLRVNGRACPPGTRPVTFLTVEDVLRHLQSCTKITEQAPAAAEEDRNNSLRAAV
ncbi:hypothetical protein [Terriglobus saanensis]|uniref:Uncharacterized protein n=1 Tax=Terriglobus saanensis (strain ATCC BAA-1853 / DSM 23119 / SP1PR4) TaxID=401053 RepID=E8V862_TERSS|nr:hypothetical protein [Terriglobus saanensis]ADV84044.1 hypothetical protein AciPR4_3289 [Terriglobus saanensis SP1PR4]